MLLFLSIYIIQTEFQTLPNELAIFFHVFRNCAKIQVAIFVGLQVAISLFFACLHSYAIFHDCVTFTIVIESKVKCFYCILVIFSVIPIGDSRIVIPDDDLEWFHTISQIWFFMPISTHFFYVHTHRVQIKFNKFS